MIQYKYGDKVTGYPCGCELIEKLPDGLDKPASLLAILFDETGVNFKFAVCEQHKRIGRLTHQQFADSPFIPEWPPTLADLDRIVAAYGRGDRYVAKMQSAYLN